MLEYTLLLLKPDAFRKKVLGKVIGQLEELNLDIVDMKHVKFSKADACQFYRDHEGKPFFQRLTDFMSSGPSLAIAIRGDSAISKLRDFIGATNPSDPRTVRGLYKTKDIPHENVVHASDSPEAAQRELYLIFYQV